MLTQNGSASGVHIINCRSSGYRLLHMVSHSQYLDSFHITNTADDLFPLFQGLVHFWYILTFHRHSTDKLLKQIACSCFNIRFPRAVQTTG